MAQPISPNLAPIIPQNSPLLQMPQDIATQFLIRVDPQDIGASAMVCKQWHQILSEDDGIWRLLFSHHFPSVNPKPIVNFQNAYQSLHSNLTNIVYASQTFPNHWGSSFSIAIDDDGILYSGSVNYTIKVFDVKTGECIATIEEYDARVLSLAIGDGVLYSGLFDNTIKIRDIKTGECKAILKGHDGPVYSLALGDGVLYSGSVDKTIKVWDIKTGECIATLKGHEGSVDSLAIGDGLLFSGSEDTTIKVWDIKIGECISTFKNKDFIDSLAIFHGRLFSSSNGSTIISDIRTGKCIARIQKDETGRNGPFAAADTRLFFSGRGMGTTRVWDFSADHSTVFQEIATLLESGNVKAVDSAGLRFSRMPKAAKNAIYGKLYEILKSFNNGYQGPAEDAFHDQNGQSATPVQKAQAIRDYLNITYPLLIDLGIANDEDYSKQLHCRPDDPQKRGIQSREDLEIICPTFTLNVESIQLAEDVQQDRLEAQKTAGQRKQKLSDVVESMSGALKKMTTEAKTSGVILYESGCPWSDLEEELNAFQNQLEEIVKRCEGPKELIEAFNADNFNLLTNRLSTLAEKFNQEFPGLYRAHQIRKLDYYINQFGILRAWKNRADQGLPQNLASLSASERTLQRLFSMGE